MNVSMTAPIKTNLEYHINTNHMKDTLEHPEAELEELIARAEAETDPMN